MTVITYLASMVNWLWEEMSWTAKPANKAKEKKVADELVPESHSKIKYVASGLTSSYWIPYQTWLTRIEDIYDRCWKPADIRKIGHEKPERLKWQLEHMEGKFNMVPVVTGAFETVSKKIGKWLQQVHTTSIHQPSRPLIEDPNSSNPGVGSDGEILSIFYKMRAISLAERNVLIRSVQEKNCRA